MNQAHFEQNGRTFVVHNMYRKPVGVVKLSSRKFAVEYEHSLQTVTMNKKIRSFWRDVDDVKEEDAGAMVELVRFGCYKDYCHNGGIFVVAKSSLRTRIEEVLQTDDVDNVLIIEI